MTLREQDRITSLIWLATGLAISYGGFRLSLGRLHEPGPGFFAFLSGSALALLSFIVFLGTLKPGGREEDEPFWESRKKLRKTIYTVGLVFLYAIGMNYLGFTLSTFLFLGAVLRIVDPQPYRTVLICSILGSAVTWFVFNYWLGVQFPGGIIGY